MRLLLEDLRKRRVVRVAVAYVLAATVLLLSLGLVERWIGLPDWTLRMVGGAAFVMLPFVLVITWALENKGPENVKPSRRPVSAPLR